MQDYSNGVHPEDEIVYQAWQRAHPQGLVVSLNRNRDGKYTLHHSSCHTVTYSLQQKGQFKRSGKICLEDQTELTQWLNTCTKPSCLPLNWCPHCK